MTIPVQVRKAIVRAVEDKGLTYQEAADLLGVGRATVSRVLSRHRKTGRVEPLPKGGGWASPIEGRIAELLKRIVAEMSDATVAELTEALIDRGQINTSRSSVNRALHRLGYSRKKSPSWRWSATPQRTDGSGGNSARISRR
jgi:transposase